MGCQQVQCQYHDWDFEGHCSAQTNNGDPMSSVCIWCQSPWIVGSTNGFGAPYHVSAMVQDTTARVADSVPSKDIAFEIAVIPITHGTGKLPLVDGHKADIPSCYTQLANMHPCTRDEIGREKVKPPMK